MLTWVKDISVLCFAASYAVAFGLEAWHLWRPRPILRVIGLSFGAAGLFAHAAYLIWQTAMAQTLQLSSPTGSLFFLAMILAVFYFYGAIHHRRIAWALFVLPVVLGLIGLGRLLTEETGGGASESWARFWGTTHGVLLILAAVGVSVGFIASVMYLVQLRRLQAKLPPGQGLPLLSLERLEEMNRHAILWAFPLLTAGLLAAFGQARLSLDLDNWLSVRVLSLVGLWIVFAILLFLRYRVHVRGRQLALWTMFAFGILILALVSPHVQGGLR